MADKTDKPACKYGEKCYQRNEAHLNRFSHPEQTVATETVQASSLRKRDLSPQNSGDGQRKKVKPDDVDDSSSDTVGSGSANGHGIQSDSESSGASPSPSKPSQEGESDSLVIESETEDADATPRESGSSSTRSNQGPNKEHDLDFIHNSFDRETRFSQRNEYKELLKTSSAFIEDKFLADMPDDFYELWNFCKEYAKHGQAPEKVFEKFGLLLVGPFDVLAGKFDRAEMFEPGDYLRHWRFFYDPPEFQTIMVKRGTEIHYGYWRDNPDNKCLIARNNSLKGCEINHITDNAISAVIYYIENDAQLTPFNRTAGLSVKKSLEAFAQQENIVLDSFSAKLKARNNLTVCKTFHKAGLIVPFDRKTTVGYRPLIESEANIKKILKKLNSNNEADVIASGREQLQPLITAANIAVDEGDFGNSIELGIDLFASGIIQLHGIVLQLLVNGYSMINKPKFIAIAKAHLTHRKRGANLNILRNSR